MRESCHNCSFKDKNNQADIILGDYWGIEVTNKEFYDDDGVTLLIVNSQKGNQYITKNKILSKVDYTDGSYEDTVKYNPLLFTSAKMPREKYSSLSKMKKYDLRYINLLVENESEKKNNKSLTDANNFLGGENYRLNEELNQVLSSRRYRLINKVGNVVSKFRRKKVK